MRQGNDAYDGWSVPEMLSDMSTELVSHMAVRLKVYALIEPEDVLDSKEDVVEDGAT